VKLTTHFHLVMRSRMRGAISPLPNTPTWRGAQLKRKAQGQLHLCLLMMLVGGALSLRWAMNMKNAGRRFALEKVIMLFNGMFQIKKGNRTKQRVSQHSLTHEHFSSGTHESSPLRATTAHVCTISLDSPLYKGKAHRIEKTRSSWN
jgi:hypothetical protein